MNYDLSSRFQGEENKSRISSDQSINKRMSDVGSRDTM